MSVTKLSKNYWVTTLLEWAEHRLPPPQFDECRDCIGTIVSDAERYEELEKVLGGRAAVEQCLHPTGGMLTVFEALSKLDIDSATELDSIQPTSG